MKIQMTSVMNEWKLLCATTKSTLLTEWYTNRGADRGFPGVSGNSCDI